MLILQINLWMSVLVLLLPYIVFLHESIAKANLLFITHHYNRITAFVSEISHCTTIWIQHRISTVECLRCGEIETRKHIEHLPLCWKHYENLSALVQSCGRYMSMHEASWYEFANVAFNCVKIKRMRKADVKIFLFHICESFVHI